jgi:hypothetical protein
MQIHMLRILCLCTAAFFTTALPQMASGKDKTITLSGESCDYKLRFDPKMANEAEIRDSFELLVLPSWAMTFGGTAFSVADVASFDEAAMSKQCAESVNKVKSLKLVPLAGVKELRSLVLKELDDSCSYHKLNAAGYKNPAVLRKYTPAASCSAFVDALEGKADLTKVFDQVSQASCQNNASTKLCLERENQKRGNPAEMKVRVQTYGWGNCAVGFLLLNTSKSAEIRAKLQKSFLKRFKAREVNCEGEEG